MMLYKRFVIPAPDYRFRGQAPAGIQMAFYNHWIPAFAGMTGT